MNNELINSEIVNYFNILINELMITYKVKYFEDVKKDLVENIIPGSDKFNFIDDYNDKFVKD